MKKEFIEKVFRNNVVDTRKYRYRMGFAFTNTYIFRIALKDLGTTAEWELVYKEAIK